MRVLLGILPGLLLAATPGFAGGQVPQVGPPAGTVIVVGGGQLGPEIYRRFIDAAGGPDALIIDVPTAGGDSAYPANWRGANPWRRAGARNVVVLHTKDRTVANSDSFTAVLRTAGGVWFEGGRQWHLVDSYAGTKTEQGFHDVLARGGVVGGSSAGASILSSYLLRGARSGNAIIMAPGYEAGFGFLRNTAIDQHVVARERLPDLADSLMPRHPELLGISEDEGTAWVVVGDVAEIVGRSKAFAYGGAETDPGKPFLTLRPGDRYNLGTRRVIARAIDGSALSEAFVDSLLTPPGNERVTVLVAQNGRVLLNKSYGIVAQRRHQPTTTVPNFPLGGLSAAFAELAVQLHRNDTVPYPRFVAQRIYTPIGARRTAIDTVSGAAGQFASNVDELYRLELGLQHPGTWVTDTLAASNRGAATVDVARGWESDRFRGLNRLSLFGSADGKRNGFVRIPERRLAVIILGDSDQLDARGAAARILERLTP